MNSILITIKRLLGIEEDVTHFDPEIIVHINSALFLLNQLGLGPKEGFVIYSKEQTWEQFMPVRKDLEILKSYIYYRVKLMFDPPTSGFVTTSMENQLKEFEWRLRVQAEGGEDFEHATYQ